MNWTTPRHLRNGYLIKQTLFFLFLFQFLFWFNMHLFLIGFYFKISYFLRNFISLISRKLKSINKKLLLKFLSLIFNLWQSRILFWLSLFNLIYKKHFPLALFNFIYKLLFLMLNCSEFRNDISKKFKEFLNISAI